MSARFFDLSSPRDMLNKAKRELAKLKSDLDIDNIFNFFVTTYHIMDYIRAAGTVPKSVTDSMYKDSDFATCQLICNKAKHLKLTKQPDKDTTSFYEPGACFGTFRFNTTKYKAGAIYRFYVDGNKINLQELAERMIQKWEIFFLDNNLG